MEIRKIIFLIILGYAVWMDLRTKELSGTFLLGAACVGAVVLAVWGPAGENWQETIFACGIGGILLFISRLIGGGIGEGDGWFFVVAGLFLSPGENGLLLLSGIFLSGIFSLLYVVAGALNGTWQRHRKSFPFLPFLLPAGLWITFAGK